MTYGGWIKCACPPYLSDTTQLPTTQASPAQQNSTTASPVAKASATIDRGSLLWYIADRGERVQKISVQASNTSTIRVYVLPSSYTGQRDLASVEAYLKSYKVQSDGYMPGPASVEFDQKSGSWTVYLGAALKATSSLILVYGDGDVLLANDNFDQQL